jgi:hypothetical protein
VNTHIVDAGCLATFGDTAQQDARIFLSASLRIMPGSSHAVLQVLSGFAVI